MAKNIVNLKAITFKVLGQLNENENHYLNQPFKAMLAGEYDGSTEFARKIMGLIINEAQTGKDAYTCNLIGNAVMDRVDTVRRYCHQWRNLKKQREAAAAQIVTVPQIVIV